MADVFPAAACDGASRLTSRPFSVRERANHLGSSSDLSHGLFPFTVFMVRVPKAKAASAILLALDFSRFPEEFTMLSYRCAVPNASLLVLLIGLFSLSAASAATLPDSLKEQLEASMAEKASRTPEQKKLDSRLVLLIRQRALDTTSLSVPVPRQSDLHPLVSADGLVAVEIKAEVSEELVAAITLEGGHIRSRAPKYDLLVADVPLMALGALVERRDVRFIKPLLPPSHNQAQAQPVSALHVAAEAMIAHAIAEARARFGVTGRGVKIGVISDSVDYLEQSQANGALPDVVVLESGTGAGEGTAMLEVVHAIAPDAELYFAAGVNRLIETVESLAAAGVDIIIDDIT